MPVDTVPPRDKACWSDAAWRTASLLKIRRTHSLSTRQVGHMTGVGEGTVWNWWSDGSPRMIPANSLRLLMLELVEDQNVGE